MPILMSQDQICVSSKSIDVERRAYREMKKKYSAIQNRNIEISRQIYIVDSYTVSHEREFQEIWTKNFKQQRKN